MSLEKTAVLGVDLEDWYHTDYIQSLEVDKNYSMLDGLDNIVSLFNSLSVKATYFVVAELAFSIKETLKKLEKENNEIASHGLTHKRPLLINKNEFLFEINKSKEILNNILSDNIIGFRAPCFSLNREYLDLLKKNNYLYDSSKMDFKTHPLYGSIDVSNFTKIYENIYIKKKFIEFQLPTTKIFGFKIPFSGGGYIRLLSLNTLKKIISKMEKLNQPVFFYFHPFEFSKKKIIKKNIPLINLARMSIGRKNLDQKLYKLILFMKKKGWRFKTFKEIYQDEKKNFNSL